MNSKPTSNPANPSKRIAIAIDLDDSVPWHHDCCAGILHYGEAQGWSCSIDPLFMDHARSGAVACYDGVVGRIDAEVAQAAQAQGTPVVNHWNNSPAKDLPSLAIDNRVSGQMAGEHLITCGYRSLGYLGVQGDLAASHCVEGLSRVAADTGLAPPAVRLLEEGFTFTDSREAFGRFLDEVDDWLTGLTAPAGLFVADVTMARYVVQRCGRLGLAVPGDVGIVAWNDNASTTALSPSLSVLDNDWFKVGYQAAALLDELMQGKKVHPQHRVVAPDRLIVRESTDVFLCEDALVKEAMQYIAAHCRQTLTIEDVAEALHVSERTLRRKFDAVLDRTVPDEIKRLRIDRLKLMVEQTDQLIGEIAEAFGFSSGGQFSRYFSTAVGMPPSAYREKFGGKTEEG